MRDALCLMLFLVCWAAAIGLIVVCDRLMPRATRPEVAAGETP